ncbi:peptidoglycan/LPS O-acetylase OafA/YrhL [Methanomicrobium sp. W14]|uniref:acyltransferase family protein n=1 Tax=Methanomicrobium sp. W14 TaxID=2817839 RepID=UPI001AE219A8|nr:acyltransferase family protein [Methanomicrobium sp. W14]MBP2133733.1 peptidoglycan/LPS O-acetylase OafA/YrhL [Methanomicrobium sp. W14]
MNTERLLFLDIIKAFAILLVIFVHMQNFLSAIIIPNYYLIEGLKFLGLACFTFASGYAIHENNMILKDRYDILHFYKKRITRVYPLYLAALFLFFICFQVLGLFHAINYSLAGWAANILCIQVLLATPSFEPVFTLWFIGFIMVMYAIYPLFSGGKGVTGKKVLAAIAVFIFLLVIHESFDIIDYRLFFYYFFFIFGMLASKAKYRFGFIEKPFKNHRKIVVPGITALAYASYCIYLFHMPVFAVTNVFIKGAGISGALQNAVLLMLIIPALFVMCCYIQKGYDKIIRKSGSFREL